MHPRFEDITKVGQGDLVACQLVVDGPPPGEDHVELVDLGNVVVKQQMPDVDLRIDFFSVFVHGLTNAYRWEDPAAGVKPGDKIGKGRKFKYKELQLNFWRPGDEFHANDQDFYYGIPGQVDFRWIYR